MKKKKFFFIGSSTICIISIVLCCVYYNRIPNYKYGEDFYYTEIINDIIENYPQYENADQYEKLSILRNYVYTTALSAKSKEEHIDFYDSRIYANDYSNMVYNLLNTYNNGEPIGGFFCGGTNFTLACLYSLLGYDSLTLDMAVIDNDKVVESHVVALVEIDNKWIIEDAYFNVEYRWGGK